MEGPFFSAPELARYLGIHPKQVYRLLKRGSLPGSQATGKWLFAKTEIDAWIARGSAGPTNTLATGPLVIAAEDDPLLDLLLEVGEANRGFITARLPASMDRALSLMAGGEVGAAVFEFTRGTCPWRWPPEITERFKSDRCQVLHLGRREIGLARRPGAKRRPLDGLAGLRLGLRPIGSATRTLFEHRLLRAGVEPEPLLAGQPTYASHQELIRALLVGEIDAALVPHHQATRYGLQSEPIAPLDLELLIDTNVVPRFLPLIEAMSSRALKERTRTWAGLTLPKRPGLQFEPLGV